MKKKSSQGNICDQNNISLLHSPKNGWGFNEKKQLMWLGRIGKRKLWISSIRVLAKNNILNPNICNVFQRQKETSAKRPKCCLLQDSCTQSKNKFYALMLTWRCRSILLNLCATFSNQHININCLYFIKSDYSLHKCCSVWT